MAIRTKKISTLIESQLPSFIVDEYPLFSKFVEKYYEAQESSGQPLDIANNLLAYNDINLYEQNLLKENSILDVTITDSDDTIVLQDASSFPEKNGYVRIDDEIIFYSTRTNTTLNDCSRGVSGNTTLGDLYEESTFVTTDSSAHNSGSVVHNVSNLFLYALIKSFESQYLASFPEKYLKGDVDKRTLIKNIRQFYKTKGTGASIRFVFNSIISNTTRDVPETYNPREFTYKSSNSDWVNIYALKCKVVSGDPKNLIGTKVVQEATEEYGYADAIVDNVFADGTADSEQIFNIVLATETVNGAFGVSTKTKLRKPLSGTAISGNRIDVFSTMGWDLTGSVLIGDETIEFDDKTVDQFIIKKRVSATALPHAADTPVYKPVVLRGSGVTLLTFGIVYNLLPSDAQPYSAIGDTIQVSNPGFETSDPKIVQTGTNTPRWLLNTGAGVNVPTLPAVASSLDGVSTNVSAILADEQYYYIASSSYPSHKILDGSTVNEEVLDQKILRLIRKEATRTTEKYKTPKRDVGIALNGVPFYGYKDPESIRYGKLEEIKVDLRGTGYSKPPFVLVDQVPNKARAILSGQVVERIEVDTKDVFPRTPDITITSGRNASVSAIVTGGKVTSLVIDNPGEFYSDAPLIVIRDAAGRGRFAEYLSVVNTDGEITGFEMIAEGNFYNQDTVIVDVVPVGNGASGIPLLKEWNYNRYNKIGNKLDTENGYVFENYNNILEYGYGYAANPKALRVALNDNINSAGSEPASKNHSPIIGFAYDGNPIYGPFGYENPLDPTSSIIRMTSSYSINGSRSEGPSQRTYPIGTFVNDYTYTHKSGTLDENNGRFTITPDFPKGTYAYFLTIDSNQVPQYPYVIGENFYSLPVDSNYNSNISQNEVPKNAKRFFEPGMQRNGEGVIAQVSEVKQGNVEAINVENTSANFSINSQVRFDNTGTEGSEAEAIVSSVTGQSVNYLESKEDKVVRLTTIQNAYLFADDTLNQPSSGASGSIVGTVKNDNTIVLRNVNGTFDETGTFSATIKTFTMLLDQRSSYTKGAVLSLTDGVNAPVATGEVLEGTSSQNVVEIKVLSGTWVVNDDYFLQSSNLFNTSGTQLVRITSLSDGLNPFEVNQSVALIETSAPHGLGIGDRVTIDINPDDATKTKNYYLRKRLYQEATLVPPKSKTTIDSTGIGRFEILNGGADYTPGTYTSVPLTSGSGTGATATFTVSAAGIVSDIQLQDTGVGYQRGDYLGVADEDLVRSGASVSTARFTIYIGHVGIPSGGTRITVDSVLGFATGDLIKIGEEIVEIVSITGNDLFVIRGKEGTEDVDHFDEQEVTLYKARYNFTANYQIFDGSTSGYIQSYDPDTQKIKIVYDYGTLTANASKVVLSSSFFDSSTPQRLVSVNSATDIEYKFEFSTDNVDFVANPNIDLQEFYKYKFDTSHSSLTGTYFDISSSINYNLITVEKTESTILPGNPGAFTDVKFGFGSRLDSNNYQTKVGTDFTNFYYFDRKNVVTSNGAYFRIVTDPLQGVKEVNYVTPNRFVYDVPSDPLWDGSGTISYTTTGQFAIGKINSVSIVNLGLNYKKVPVVVGADPTTSYRATAKVLFDEDSQVITGVEVTNKGKNYVNPKVFVLDADGSDAIFKVLVRNGEISFITVEKPGRGYTYAPEIIIVEGEVDAYVESTSIGVPRSVNITTNGGAFHLDKTVSSTFSSNYILSLTDFSGDFKIGEQVVQKINNVVVFRGTVEEWRFGSNLLKIKNTTGIVRNNINIESVISGVYGKVKSVFVTTFAEDINSFYDNLGFYTSDKGKLGVSNQKIIDSFFYQDYSYVIKSKTSIEQWRDLIKSTTHPAGFKLFGQVDVEGTASTEMPAEMPKSSHFSVVQLWDPDKNKITVESTKQILTQTIQKVENTRIHRGVGTAARSEFLFNEVRALEFSLGGTFDGYYDNDGRLQGTKTFQILNDLGNPFTPASSKGVIVTLDGVIQEPDVAYTISGDQITFAAPPLGDGTKNGSDYKGVTFYGKIFQFKDDQYNTKHLRKLRNIFQRGGTWIDAANQIERNAEFIINETIGYGKATYTTLDWATKQDDYERNIRAILDAYQHDIRFGGNIKTIDYTSIFNQDDDYLYIQNNKTQSSAIFAYATRLAKLAIRNWDYVDVAVSYFAASNKVNLSSTKNVAIGMFISSGRSFPTGTKIVSIDSETQITVSNSALANSGGGGGAAVGTTLLSGTATSGAIPTNTGAVAPGNEYNLPPGTIVTVPTSFSSSDQATFSWSGLNNGTFYDGATLIAANRADIITQSLNWAKTQYPSLNWEDPASTRVQATVTVDTLRTLDVGSVQILKGEVDENTLCEDKNDGYETPPQLYVFPAENTVVSPTNAVGTGVELSADLELNGYVKEINITNGGSGYDPANPPTVTLGGDMAKLTAVATVTGTAVTAITITDYTIGQRYVEVTVNNETTYVEQENFSNKVITIDGNAEAEIVLGKRVGNIWITESGSNFSDALEKTYIRGIGGNPQNIVEAECDTRKFTTFGIANAGYGYVSSPTVTLTSSGVGQFLPTASAEIDDEGRITSVTIESEGSYGYTVTGANITGFAPGGTYDVQTKCYRDIGLILDAYVYHLKFGGNEKVVNAAQLYYRNNEYPYGEELYYISGQLTETVATFAYAKNLMIAAMKNQGAVTDPNVLVDSASPACAEVESALNTFHSIIDTILTEGKGLVEITKQNPNKPGNWTPTVTYSNYNILMDPAIPQQECSTVISAMDSLYTNLDDVLKEESVTRTLPDYVDGETKEFELYWDDNTVVNTEEDEDLFLTLNAVLQRPKYTEGYPLDDAYFIDRTVIPNLIKFDVAPIWDQDIGAKTIGEPTAVEKVVGIGVGNYKRLTIDYNLVNGVRNGPFLILDVEDYTVQSIEAEDALYVFLDGVLQREGYSYTVSGPNITFNVPIQKEMKIDIRYLYGRDVGQVLNIYDYAPDTYFAQGQFSFNADQVDIEEYFKFNWMGDSIGSAVHVWQVKPDGTYNTIGEISNPVKNAGFASFNLKCQNPYTIAGLDYVFAVKGKYNRTFTFADSSISNVNITFKKDEYNRKLLRDDNAIWYGTFFGKTYKQPFVYLSNGDKIRVDGEEGFRNIKQLPDEATSKDGRDGEQTTDDIFGTVSIERYTGVSRGEGLSVVATIENGSVTKLTWNQRSYDPITQPTAYQYFTPPVLKFETLDGNGGGAKANVLVSKGQVISVDLIDGGSGYTTAPKVITTRQFDILKERDIGVSIINVSMNPVVENAGISITSTIDILGNRLVDAFSFSSVDLSSPADISRKIEAEIQTGAPNVVGGGSDMPVDSEQPGAAQIVYIEPEPVEIEGIGGVLRLQDSVSVVSAEIQDIVIVNSITTVSKAITTTIENVIPNDALSNVNYFENGAYLDVDFNIGDSIAYIPDTFKFYETGLLLVGDEVVSYARKLSDRFLNVIRARRGTIEQNWVAGTFLRQIPEFVSVAPVGLVQVQSESDVKMVSASATAGGFERKTQRQVGASDELAITRAATEVVVIPPPGGVVDGYQEEVFLADPVAIRDGNTTGGHDGEVDLIEINDGYHVARRNSTEVLIVNSIFGRTEQYIGNYTKTNVGHTIGHFEGIFDDGAAGVSGLSLGELDLYFGALTIKDFEERGDSSYTLSGEKFIMMPPSIQNPVAISSSAGTIGGIIIVQDTTYFPDEGQLFTSGGTVIQYTGKTSVSFTGCTLVSGPNSIANGDELVPFTN